MHFTISEVIVCYEITFRNSNYFLCLLDYRTVVDAAAKESPVVEYRPVAVVGKIV